MDAVKTKTALYDTAKKIYDAKAALIASLEARVAHLATGYDVTVDQAKSDQGITYKAEAHGEQHKNTGGFIADVRAAEQKAGALVTSLGQDEDAQKLKLKGLTDTRDAKKKSMEEAESAWTAQ